MLVLGGTKGEGNEMMMYIYTSLATPPGQDPISSSVSVYSFPRRFIHLPEDRMGRQSMYMYLSYCCCHCYEPIPMMNDEVDDELQIANESLLCLPAIQLLLVQVSR